MLRFMKSTTLVMAIVLILSVAGVSATWKYATRTVASVHQLFRLNVFPWEGSEILPEEDEVGQNHRLLIESVLNHPTEGLNAGSESYLNEQIKKRKKGSFLVPSRDTLGSMAITQGEQLEIFVPESSGLEFLIYFVSDTEYELYTTGVALGERKNPATAIGQWIHPIYKTKLVCKDGVWIAESTKIGSAKSAYYEESQPNITVNMSKIPSFDPESWVEDT